MKKTAYILIFIGTLFYIPSSLYAQKQEESAEISLEENKDEFQEHFFEAIKQRGIENYDRAIDALLKCEKIDDNASIAFELGKNYFSIKEYEKAKTFFEKAAQKKPQNQWYLIGLFNSQLKLKENDNAIQTGNRIVILYPKFKENLAKVYVSKKEFKKALQLLNELEIESGLSRTTAYMKRTIERRMKGIKDPEKARIEAEKHTEKIAQKNTQRNVFIVIENKLKANNFQEAKALATKTLNQFPSEPKLYLYNAKASYALKEYKEAVEMLEIGLDFIIDNRSLEQEFYKAFVSSYKGMGNHKKATYYQKKLH